MNRWWVVVGAVLINLCLGAIYAWSAFTGVLSDAGWTNTETQAPFSAGLASFAGSMFLVGWLAPRLPLRLRAVLGGLLLGGGYILAGLLGPTDPIIVFVCIGLVGGAGIGVTYVVPIAIGMLWFPDRKGMITGLAVAGFGFGAMIWVKLAGDWGNLLETIGIGQTFILYGGVFVVTCLLGSITMVRPPAGWVPPMKTRSAGPSIAMPAPVPVPDRNLGQMLRTVPAYLILFAMLAATGAGLMCIGLMKLVPTSALVANGVDPAAAGAIAGTAMGVCYALGNGLGRILWGVIADSISQRRSVYILLATQGIFVAAFPQLAGTETLLYASAALIGFNFGGIFSLFPLATAEAFGKANLAQNYGFIFLAYGIGGIFGPMLGGALRDSGNTPLAFWIAGGLCIVAIPVWALVKPLPAPRHDHGPVVIP